MMTKLLLAAIALGLWANVWVTLVRPTQAQTTGDSLADLSHTIASGRAMRLEMEPN
jgi:hypothetical protein